MTEDRDRLEELFHAALDRPAEERAAFLDQACEGDAALRTELDSLLDAATDAPGFLEAPAHATFEELDPSLAGKRFGRYRIVRRIASGGMGSVFEAEQDEPRRTVALKLLRAGAIDRRVLERFRLEAEVLGRLRHPGIAQVFEAGVSEVERAAPWITMEYVAGARNLLEQVCAANPPLERRLALFLAVCDAVHHGHQKGVVHRDLKPSNVLVDEDGRVKVIDFGVARVVDEERHAMLTGHGELVGTLQYMSPEQCAGDPDRVDVRTDVYALGLLLYEMLCERRPYDVSGLPLTEAVQAVVEREPTRPSRVNPDLPRDLEAVIRKALEKDPDRRYSSVDALADDLRRFLRHEPVAASPPGPAHALLLFARRRPAVVFAVAALAVSAAVSAGFAIEARRAQRRAETDAITRGQMFEFVLDLFARAAPDVAQGEEPRVTELFDGALERVEERLRGQPLAQIQTLWTIARIQQDLNRHADSLPLIQRALELRREHELLGDVDEARLLRHRARARRVTGDLEGAKADFEEALAILRSEFGPDHRATVACAVDFAGLLLERGELEPATRLLEGVVRLDPSADDGLALAIANLGLVHYRKGELEEAERRLEDAVAQLSAAGDPLPVERAKVLNLLALVLKLQGRLDEARPLYEEALAIHARLVPDDERALAAFEMNLGALLVDAKELAPARVCLRWAHAAAERSGSDGVLTMVLRQEIDLAAASGRHAEAEGLARLALHRARSRTPVRPPEVGEFLFRLAEARLASGHARDAVASLDEAIGCFLEHPHHAEPLSRVRALLDTALREDEAAPAREDRRR